MMSIGMGAATPHRLQRPGTLEMTSRVLSQNFLQQLEMMLRRQKKESFLLMRLTRSQRKKTQARGM